jgi:hypothetical protein
MNTTELRGHDHTGAKWTILLAVTGLVLATPVAVWWLVGDQTAKAPGQDLDYAIRPVELDPGIERLVGITSVLAVAVTALLLIRAARRHRFDPRWWSVVIPLVGAGIIVGAGWRVLTAGVIGANIGAGLVILFGGPVVLALLLWAAVRSVYLVRSRRRAVPT